MKEINGDYYDNVFLQPPDEPEDDEEESCITEPDYEEDDFDPQADSWAEGEARNMIYRNEP